MSPRPSVDRQDEILDAALKIFSKKGFDGSRTKEIADEAGLSEATIFKYFPTKKHLLLALVGPFIKVFVRPVFIDPIIDRIHKEENRSIRETLHMVLLDRAQLFRKHSTLIGTLALEAARHPDILNVFRTTLLPEIVKVIEGIVETGKKNGEVRNLDSTLIARSVMSLLMGFVVLSSIFPEHMKLGDDSAEIETIIDLLINGIALRTEKTNVGAQF